MDSGAEGPGFKSQPQPCWVTGNSLRQTVHTHCASVHQAAKLVAALLRVAGVTAGLAESNGSLPPGLRRMDLPYNADTVLDCRLHKMYKQSQFTTIHVVLAFCLQCFDAVGWAAGRASGL